MPKKVSNAMRGVLITLAILLGIAVGGIFYLSHELGFAQAEQHRYLEELRHSTSTTVFSIVSINDVESWFSHEDLNFATAMRWCNDNKVSVLDLVRSYSGGEGTSKDGWTLTSDEMFGSKTINIKEDVDLNGAWYKYYTNPLYYPKWGKDRSQWDDNKIEGTMAYEHNSYDVMCFNVSKFLRAYAKKIDRSPQYIVDYMLKNKLNPRQIAEYYEKNVASHMQTDWEMFQKIK